MAADIYTKAGADAAFLHDTAEGRQALAQSPEVTSTIDAVGGEKFGSVLPITAFASGLTPGADITAALRAAIAAVRVSTVYGGQAGATIWVPPGAWKISSTILVDVPVSIRGSLERASSLRLVDGVNGDMLQIAVGVTGFELSDITLDGNKANQTATSHGVNFLGNTADANYKGAGELNNINIRNFRDDGIRAGRLRSNGRLSNVTSGSNGGNGLYFEGYDWIIGDRCDFGENGLAGIRANGDNVQASNIALYGNKNNLYIDVDCGRSTWNNLVCESSTEDLIVINSAMQSRTHTFHGSFGNAGNVPANTGLYSAFKVMSAAQITILGHLYDATGDATPCLPKYIVDNIAAGCLVDVGGFNWKASAYTDSFASNGVNNITGIQTRIVIPASMLSSVGAVATGQSAIATIWPVASMPSGQNTRLAVNLGHLPRRWKTFDLYVRSVKIGTGSGSVALRPLHSQRANGDDLSAASVTLGIQVVATAAQSVRKDTLIASQIVVDSTKEQLVAVDRRAANSADGDTLAEAYGIEALEIRWRA